MKPHLRRLLHGQAFAFFVALSLLATIFSGPRSTALALLFLLPAYTLAATLLRLFRLPLAGIGPGIHFLRLLLGLGLLSLTWTVCGLWSAGRVRPLCVILVLAAALAATIPLTRARRKETPNAMTATSALDPVFWLLPLALMIVTILPFRNLGRPTERGFAYRAYFSTDYLKQFSLVQELSRGRLPPQNPYFAGVRLHYYWLPFALPALIQALDGDVQDAMMAFSAIVNFMLLGSLFLLLGGVFCARAPSRPLQLLLTFIPVLFLSLEGTYLLLAHLAPAPISARLAQVSAFNVDALTRWLWGTPQIDSLLRTLLYMPQAGVSLAFFVVYLVLRRLERPPFGLQLALLILSLSANLLIGTAFLIFLGLDILYGVPACRKSGTALRLFAGRALALFTALTLFVSFLATLGILAIGNRPLRFSPLPPAQILPLLLLNLGPLLILGLIGGCQLWKKEPILPACLILLAAMCTLSITGFGSEFPLKFSLVLQVLLLLATAEFWLQLRQKSRVWSLLLFAVFLLALPSGMIDIANSSAIGNERFTFYLQAEEARLLRRAAKLLPAAAVVQDYPPEHAEGISVIPTFMDRPTFVGDEVQGRLFFIKDEDYQRRLALVHRCFQDLAQRKGELAAAGVNFVYWGAAEKEAFGYVPRLKAVVRGRGAAIFALR